jgi:hypothetical protein
VTEAEWLASDDPQRLWGFVSEGANDRRWRLLAVALCRCAWPLLLDGRSRAAVEVAERYADGEASEDERVAACLAANGADITGVDSPAAQAAVHAAMMSHHLYISCEAAHEALSRADGADASGLLAGVVRDIFGNPFRPVTADPAWLTPTVVSLAEGIYAERAFDRLTILADALQDAGCEDADILAHCRSGGPHVRGCWVVDLLTGRG